MKGRPRKAHLEVRWDAKRERYLVTVPASWTGKQSRKWFESEGAAHLWIAQRELERASNKPLALHEGQDSGRSVAGLVEMFLSEREGKAGHRAVANHLDKLSAQFGGSSLGELHPYAVKEWLRALPGSKRTRWGVFCSCRTLGRWAMRYQFAERNPFDSVEPPDKGTAPKAILTVEQMQALLEIPKPTYVQAWIVLGAFAGLRSEEILRMKWDCLDFRAKEIHVPADAIKKTGGMRERYVAMLPVFVRLVPRNLKGRIIPVSRTTFHSYATRLAVKLGYEQWPHNALRHSFASYHLAQWEDAGKTAHQLGHTSTAMVFQNYARAVKKAEAEKWWNSI